ncbi:MAG: polyprenyl synthetase family protein [Bacteroidetes bacterium]|nr:polyprenyl synthetase family protein [Bacteroidota bacterium]
MGKLDEIRAPIKDHIQGFEKYFRSSMKSSVPLLDKVMQYILKRKGKQMRPMFVFLSASVCGGINDSTYRAAALIELLHTATLVHDDVVDDSNERRGFFSINALWKNKIAVLVGDYLLSRGLLLSVNHNDHELLKIVSDAVREMSEGELLQIEKARRLDIKEDIYFEIIRKKTASLIASCCACGAQSSGVPAETVEKMRSFGEKVGIAFQIKDDLFDYEKSNETGKPRGIDIKEKKLTLPLIYLLNHSDKGTRRGIIRNIKRYSDNGQKVSEIISRVNGNGGIEYARSKMIEYRQEALNILDSFPESIYRQSMHDLVIYTTERNK